MKKIMFDDKYGLTKAVLEGRKTMTRRIISGKDHEKASTYRIDYFADTLDALSEEEALLKFSPYKVGEVVAVAQNYKEVGVPEHCMVLRNGKFCDANATGGWTNKMFVHPDHMKHFVRITNVRVERLQDISDEDCIREGLCWTPSGFYVKYEPDTHSRIWLRGMTHRSAFAALIDKVSGKGTWERNPWVFVYEFELVK